MKEDRYQLILPEADGLELNSRIEEDEGILYIHFHIVKKIKGAFPAMKFKVVVPSCEIHYLWNPKIHLIKALNLDWFQGLKKTNGFTGAPVQCLIGRNNENRAALAISDTLDTFLYSVVPVEETGEYAFEIEFFTEDAGEQEEYETTFRLDLRKINYSEVLRDTSEWWAQYEKNKPAYVPDIAKRPMYSTWYSFHQKVEERALLEQCRLAAGYGCKCLLLDDGWQTDDSSRGYAYCGDWENAMTKIPDMKRFTEKVHALGMQVAAWYSVPFIGVRSRNFDDFKDMLIDPEGNRGWHVLDPRYPMVREFIISTYEQALENWDLDGFKLDFVDEFVVTPFSGKVEDNRRDCRSFAEAADILMKECIRRLKARKPNILVEFRQTYNGPLMRSYGNIFRAVDCPFDDLENHVRVTDIRLLAGESAVHSDMLMWHPDDSPESAALQLIQVMFSVPQISMRLERLNEKHKKMLKFYLELWQKYRDVFINGTFEPLNPSCRYNVIRGCYGNIMACTYHSMEVITIDKQYDEMVFINGTGKTGLYIQNKMHGRDCYVTIYNCMGELISDEKTVLAEGIHFFRVPPSGTMIGRT